MHDLHGDWNWALFSVICRTWGETVLGDVLRTTQARGSIRVTHRAGQMTPEEALQQAVEGMRGHFAGPGRTGAVTVIEEPQRYVMSFDPCGSGGRMRGEMRPGAASHARTEPPYNFVNIEGAYPWTWNQKGVCAYCAHCAVACRWFQMKNSDIPCASWSIPPIRSPFVSGSSTKIKMIPPEAYTAVGHAPPDIAT